MKKLILIAVALFIFVTTDVQAQESDFSVDADVVYEVDTDGVAKVTHNITIENNVTEKHATNYRFDLDGIDPQNIIATQGDTILDVNTITTSGTESMIIDFEDYVVGKDEKREFSFSYNDESVATRTGEVWEIIIPKIGDGSFRDYNVKIIIPESFGKEAFISPRPLSYSQSGGNHIYSYSIDEIKDEGVNAGFGEFQVFEFELNYHLENPLLVSSTTHIALPPDTATQKIHYSDITPQPDDIIIDEDGNWLARYILGPRDKIEVKAKGYAQIYGFIRPGFITNESTNEKNLAATARWQKDDVLIQKIAKEVNSPREIYDYVVDFLDYDFGRLDDTYKEYSAKEILSRPDMAICTDFTNLFISLARANGIPAREVQGYAYSEDRNANPLSLSGGVLHSWVEYWDEERQSWVPVDPTWADTSGGLNYFDNLDLRHFAFVIHGVSDVEPYPAGSYRSSPQPGDDVIIKLSELPASRYSDLEITARRSTAILPFLGSIEVVIYNPGPIALYDIPVRVNFDNETVFNERIVILPPFSKRVVPIEQPLSFLGKNTPDNIIAEVDHKRLNIETFKSLFVSIQIVIVLIVLLAIIIVIVAKSGLMQAIRNMRN